MLWLLRLCMDRAFWGNLEKQERTLYVTVTRLPEMEVLYKLIIIDFPIS